MFLISASALLFSILVACMGTCTSQDVCLISAPCPCSNTTVSCSGQHLTSIPPFLESTSQPPTLTSLAIRLDSNRLLTIDGNTFSNLAATNVTSILLYISNNNINQIDDDAFDGIENAVKYLYLSKNNLSSIPDALSRLINLETLYIDHNPLLSMSSGAIQTIGGSLSTFHLSMDLFSAWPSEFGSFQRLTELHVYGFPLSTLPVDAMQGLQLEMTLKHLQFTHTQLTGIPEAVCDLQALHSLYYTNNTNTASSMSAPCDMPMATVTYLDLSSNDLRGFPDVLTTFTSLAYLVLDSNGIGVVDSSLIPADYPLKYLHMNHNLLNEIPSAFLHFERMYGLEVRDNHIKGIEENDLDELLDLKHLDISNNPVEYVSDMAFHSQSYLVQLFLRNTRLTAVPRAVTSLTYIEDIRLEDTAVECTCKMTYLSDWLTNNTRLHGSCSGSGESLATFVKVYLPNCT